jgi:hypothetical protein
MIAAATIGEALLLAGPAVAAEPLRVVDTTDGVFLDAVHADRGLEISVQRSVGSGSGTSEWTDATFRASVELLDDEGHSVGTVLVTGTYAPVGDEQREVQRFNDGNVHVVMDHSTTSLAVSDLSVSLDGAAFQVERVLGDHQTGSLFVSQPATYVGTADQVVISEPVTENVAGFSTDTDHGLSAVGFDLQYVDSPLRASGGVDLTKPTWNGTFGLYTEEGEHVGRVAATATVTAKGRTVRFFERDRGGFDGWSYTPYQLNLAVDGPVSPARITANLAVIRYSWHTSPLDAAATRDTGDHSNRSTRP